MRTIVHVNRQIIAHNVKHGTNLPIYTIKQGRRTTYAHAVRFTGPSELVDPRDQEQLTCGARAWVETDHPVELVEPMSWAEVFAMRKATV